MTADSVFIAQIKVYEGSDLLQSRTDFPGSTRALLALPVPVKSDKS